MTEANDEGQPDKGSKRQLSEQERDAIVEQMKKDWDQRLARLREPQSLSVATSRPARRGKVKLGPSW